MVGLKPTMLRPFFHLNEGNGLPVALHLNSFDSPIWAGIPRDDILLSIIGLSRKNIVQVKINVQAHVLTGTG